MDDGCESKTDLAFLTHFSELAIDHTEKWIKIFKNGMKANCSQIFLLTPSLSHDYLVFSPFILIFYRSVVPSGATTKRTDNADVFRPFLSHFWVRFSSRFSEQK